MSSYGYGGVQDRFWTGVLGDHFQSGIIQGVNCYGTGLFGSIHISSSVDLYIKRVLYYIYRETVYNLSIIISPIQEYVVDRFRVFC